jgi:CheY-like chemotaxis protein
MMNPSTSPILVVDDDVDTCANMADILGDLGYQIDVAYQGGQAVKLAEQTPYGLALLDYKLPCMTGVDLYQHLKRLQPQTEGILITGYASGDTVQRAADAGFRSVLPKPVDFSELILLVQQIVGQRRA